VQQGVVTVSQGDRVILKGEKCGGLYKLKEGNLVQGEVSGISWEESSLRGGASRKTTTNVNRVKVLREGEMLHSSKARDGPSRGGKSTKGSGERK